jgi:hypothetical protein
MFPWSSVKSLARSVKVSRGLWICYLHKVTIWVVSVWLHRFPLLVEVLARVGWGECI